MGKRFFDKRCKYSIRKFSVGVASVMIGATFFASPIALATEAETPTEGNGTISEAPALDKLPDDVLKAIEKAEKEAEANKPAADEATSHEEAKPTEAETTTAATEVKPTEEATSTEATTTETNTATETTRSKWDGRKSRPIPSGQASNESRNRCGEKRSDEEGIYCIPNATKGNLWRWCNGS